MIQHLRQMAIFAKTIDHGSFRAAAKALNLSPSVISEQLSQLENQLGVALIYRSTRSLSLTRDGEQLLKSARAMLEEAESGLEKISNHTSQPSGILSITMPAVLAHSKLVDQLSSFANQHPNVELSVDFSDARRNLINDGFDLAIRMGWLKDSALIARKLSTVNRRLVASKTYLTSKPEPITPQDLKAWEWVELSEVKNRKEKFLKEDEKPITIKPMSHISVNDAHALYQFARAGAGLSLVPEFLAEEDVRNGIVEYVLPDWHVESLGIYAVWPENASRNSLTRILVDFLVR